LRNFLTDYVDHVDVEPTVGVGRALSPFFSCRQKSFLSDPFGVGGKTVARSIARTTSFDSMAPKSGAEGDAPSAPPMETKGDSATLSKDSPSEKNSLIDTAGRGSGD